jgi:hypothetical protein
VLSARHRLGNHLRVVRLLGAAAALAESVNAARLAHHERYERALAATSAELDAAAFDEAWAMGHALLREAIASLTAEIVPAGDGARSS